MQWDTNGIHQDNGFLTHLIPLMSALKHWLWLFWASHPLHYIPQLETGATCYSCILKNYNTQGCLGSWYDQDKVF